MLRDGYITVTQLRHLRYVTVYLKVLFGETLSEDIVSPLDIEDHYA
jgi:hypothetical protein